MIETQGQNMGKSQHQILLEDLEYTSFRRAGNGNGVALLTILKPERDHFFVTYLLDPQHARAERCIVSPVEIRGTARCLPGDIERRRPRQRQISYRRYFNPVQLKFGAGIVEGDLDTGQPVWPKCTKFLFEVHSRERTQVGIKLRFR